MVTIFKTISVTNILNLSKSGYKFNMLMCYCIALAAESREEFYLLPSGKKFIQYNSLGVSVIVPNKNNGINFCKIPFDKNIDEFNRSYLELTRLIAENCENNKIEDAAIIGTSNLSKHCIDGAINLYDGVSNNPFIVWGKCEELQNEKVIKLSFQFHHAQMDGEDACCYLEDLQRCISNLR